MDVAEKNSAAGPNSREHFGELTNAHNVPRSVIPFLSELTLEPKVDQIVLFGSRAVGDHDARADVDVAVVGPLTRLEFSALRLRSHYARTLYWISVVHYQQMPVALGKRVREQGVVLYERKKGTG
jgi:predicted nucleotidyltransferase